MPSVKEQRETLVAKVRALVNRGEQTVQDASHKAQEGWREGLDKVEKNTGLKVA